MHTQLSRFSHGSLFSAILHCKHFASSVTISSLAQAKHYVLSSACYISPSSQSIHPSSVCLYRSVHILTHLFHAVLGSSSFSSQATQPASAVTISLAAHSIHAVPSGAEKCGSHYTHCPPSNFSLLLSHDSTLSTHLVYSALGTYSPSQAVQPVSA